MREVKTNIKGKDLEIIRKSLVRNRNLKLVFGFCFFCAGMGMAFSRLYMEESASVYVFSGYLLLAFGGCFTGLTLLRFNVEKEDIFRLLVEHPEKIAWIYYHKVENMPYGIKVVTLLTLHFHTLNKQKHALRMNELEANKVMSLLRSRLPHATFGYSISKEQLYIANPALLLN